MGLFGVSTPFDADIEKATSETNTDENWSLILDVCDKVTMCPRNAKECLKSIMKRMSHTDPHVVMLALTLLDACVSNCGKPFHLEIASREFSNEYKRLLAKSQPKIAMKMRQMLRAWAENDFKHDPELNLIPSLYLALRVDGHDFGHSTEKALSKSAKAAAAAAAAALKDPNVVGSQQEEDDIAKAIELSLKESKNSPKQQASVGVGSGSVSAYPSLYPSFGGAGTTVDAASASGAMFGPVEPRKVRALYDFEAVEENELTFFAGDILNVVDDSDVNWWKGYNHRGEGLFPANFVSADLSVDLERLDLSQQNKSKKTVQFEDDARELQLKTEAAAVAAANQPIDVDEGKIDRLLHLLHEANPEDPSQDSDEMLRLEQEVHQMGPLIDAELERVDRKHAQLTQLSSDLVDAINLYHSLMRDDRAALLGMNAGGAAGYMGAPMPGAAYHGAPNAQMMYGGGGAVAAQAAGYVGFMPQQPPMPHNYGGMPSMQYAPQVGGGAPNPPQSATHMPQQQQHQLPPQIPLQFQNGNISAPSLNGGGSALSAAMALQQQQHAQQQHAQQQHAQQQQQQQQQQLPMQQPQQQMYAPGPQEQLQQQASAQSYQMLAQQHHQQQLQQQQQQQQQPQPPQQHAFQAQPQTPSTATGPSSIVSPQQHQQQFMPAHGSPYNMPQQYAPLPNVAGPQATYIPAQMMQQPQQPPAQASNGVGMGMAIGPADQYSQLQQQMAAMSMQAAGGMPGGGMQHQPVTHNFLNVQNEAKNNIPIYQQQR